MCTRKREIKITFQPNNENIWKMPSQMISYYNKGEQPYMLVKCGKCYECKQERARNWIFKTWLEAKDHKEKCFITLTLKNTKIEKGKNLNKKDLQDFIKRLRKAQKLKNFKYFAAGEYGEKKGRAHYHIIALGYIPNDLRQDKRYTSKRGNDVYISDYLTELWGKGVVTINQFHKDEIPYLTLYIDNNSIISKKINYIQLNKRKLAIQELHYKYGIATNIKNIYNKIKNIKDLDKKTFKKYKKEYNKKVLTIKLKKEPEFNIYSKGMGFNRFIKDKYYKYDLILDNYKIEIPKEYLRKIIENQDKYSKEIIKYITYELLSRREYAEINYIDPLKDKEKLKLELAKEQIQIDQEQDRIKLFKIHESDF